MAKFESNTQTVEKPQNVVTKYWIGITGPVNPPELSDDDPPPRDRLLFDRVTCGAMDFCRWSESVSAGPDGSTDRSKQIGRVVPLNARQLAAIKAAAKHKVVRQIGYVGQIHDSRDARYVPEPDDVPLGSFLYCYEAGTRSRDQVPEANLV